MEQLYWLDLKLIEALPETVRDPYSDEMQYYGVRAFFSLVSMYEREGFLAEALEIARISARFGNANYVEDLEERQAALRAEDGG